MVCKWHLCSEKLSGRQTVFCSLKCKNKFHVTKKRQGNKAKLVDEFGGRCIRCGYDKSVAALHFHHIENDKSFGIAFKGATVSYEKLKSEAEKCILICANCHAEEHSGVAQ
jgi:hypothetical protein